MKLGKISKDKIIPSQRKTLQISHFFILYELWRRPKVLGYSRTEIDRATGNWVIMKLLIYDRYISLFKMHFSLFLSELKWSEDLKFRLKDDSCFCPLAPFWFFFEIDINLICLYIYISWWKMKILPVKTSKCMWNPSIILEFLQCQFPK